MRTLPDFPWDRLAPYGDLARKHPDGIVDMSVGTPVDSTPEIIQSALTQASNAAGYPTTIGSVEFRQAAINWLQRRFGVTGLSVQGVIPTIGSKEMVAWLPTFLSLGVNDVVAIPATAYPTYDVGARLAGCEVVTADSVTEYEAARVAASQSGKKLSLIWLNSPSNPTGQVLSAEQLAAIVTWARQHGIVVASDECYIELDWDRKPTSILHPSVVGNSLDGVLLVNSLSKRSNIAGYRVGILAGDSKLVSSILEIRKHAGMIMPTPIQDAAVAAFDDDAHVQAQKNVYGRRRDIVKSALESVGFDIEFSNAGLYLWATRHEDCWSSVQWFAERGILVTPGEFYGAAGQSFVRVALTVTDERVTAFAQRLTI